MYNTIEVKSHIALPTLVSIFLSFSHNDHPLHQKKRCQSTRKKLGDFFLKWHYVVLASRSDFYKEAYLILRKQVTVMQNQYAHEERGSPILLESYFRWNSNLKHVNA